MPPEPVPPALVPYQAGTRRSRRTGELLYVYEFKQSAVPVTSPAASAIFTLEEEFMDAIEMYVASLIVSALHKSAPTMTADDDAKVTKSVQDFVTVSMDLAAVYFVLRAAKATPAAK